MSQVTKPIALDETLQDVVTAIQGITQGGMIVSTGNVGSATQPVYINGGVPTAIEAVDRVKEVRNAYGDANTLNALNTVNFTEIYNGSHTPAASTSESYMYLTGQGGDANNGGVQFAVGAYPSTNDKIFYRRYNGGSWGSWKQLYGIQTGTPTDINSALSLSSSSYMSKSGNVVNFMCYFGITTTPTLTPTTTLFKLPWSSAAGSGVVTLCMREVVYGNNLGGTVGYSYIIGDTVSAGTNGATDIVSGKYLRVSGTYLTND